MTPTCCIQENKDRNRAFCNDYKDEILASRRAASRRTRIETRLPLGGVTWNYWPTCCIQENKDRNTPARSLSGCTACRREGSRRAASRRTRIETRIAGCGRQSQWRLCRRAASRRTRIETDYRLFSKDGKLTPYDGAWNCARRM